MLFIRKLILRFLYRDQTRNGLAESHLILLKCARRCAYDLKHAADNIPNSHWSYEIFNHRGNFWLKIFTPTGVKDYRLEMIDKIEKLESEVAMLRHELKANGIESKVPTRNPF